jgi:hypothetical protein
MLIFLELFADKYNSLKKSQETHFSKTYLNDDFHITNIGTMIEEMENTLRAIIEEIYIKKSKEVNLLNLDYRYC